MNKPRDNHTGFTIVELLIVIVVIGILAAITIVAYSGIQSRAIVATMQSDLTNASTTLRMDQVTTSAFPATLALANNGKGITQGQSLDSILYIPDNTSNPNNFCLTYRKGTTTYAVDNNSQPTKGVCLTNLITNGDFSNGSIGWFAGYGTTTTSVNVISDTANGGATYSQVAQTCSGCAVSGHQIYATFRQMVTNSSASNIGINISDPISNKSYSSITNPIANNWYINSGIVTFTGTGDMNFKPFQYYIDGATANGKIMQLQYAAAFDLTVTFGAGNEPTKSQMDTIMTSYPNNWFNIVAKANL